MGDEQQFISYQKRSVVKIETIKHTVRLRLNDKKSDIIKTLENVPDDAIVSMVVDDTALGAYGEIIFEEHVEYNKLKERISNEIRNPK